MKNAFYPVSLYLVSFVLFFSSCATYAPNAQRLEKEEAMEALQEEERREAPAPAESKLSESEQARDFEDQGLSDDLFVADAPTATAGEYLDVIIDEDAPGDRANFTVHLPEAKVILDEIVGLLQDSALRLSEEDLSGLQKKLESIEGEFYWVPQQAPGQSWPRKVSDWNTLRSAPWYDKARWQDNGLEGYMDDGGRRRLRLYRAVVTESGGFQGVVLVTL